MAAGGSDQPLLHRHLPSGAASSMFYLHKRRLFLACLIFFTVSLVLTLLYINNYQLDYAPLPLLSGKMRFKSRSGYSKAVEVYNPYEYLNSRTVGPICDSLLLVVVTSALGNVERRMKIRETWAQRHEYNRRYDWQYVFAVGAGGHGNNGSSKDDNDREWRDRLVSELTRHGDILFGDYSDTYRNLTTKVMHALVWAKTSCSRTRFIFKTDDDCFVNTVVLPSLIQDYHADDEKIYLGRMFTSETDLTVLRSQSLPWSLTRQEYPHAEFPPYVSGSGYLLSIDLVEAIIERSKYIRPFPVEDAYIGVVVNALGVQPINSGRFTFQSSSWTMCNFLYLILIHNVSPENLLKFHQFSINAQKLCKEPFISRWH